MSMISVKGLRKTFGKNEVLKGVDIEIQPGEVVAIVGPSGCGKSTFLRCLNLLEKPTGGSIIYHGTDLVTAPPKESTKLLLGMGMVTAVLPEEDFPLLTENNEFYGGGADIDTGTIGVHDILSFHSTVNRKWHRSAAPPEHPERSAALETR